MRDNLVELGMTKLADDNKDKLRAGAVGAGVGLGGKKISEKIIDKIDPSEMFKGKTTQKQMDKIRDAAGFKNINVTPGDVPEYNHILDRISFDKDNLKPSIFAHEVGHKMNAKKGGGKARLTFGGLSQGYTDKVSPLVAGGGVAAYKHQKDKNPELAKKIRKGTMAASILPSVPKLYEEAKASKNALGLLNKAGIKERGAKKTLGRAWGTYGASLAPALLAGGYFAQDAIRDKLKEKRDNRGSS